MSQWVRWYTSFGLILVGLGEVADDDEDRGQEQPRGGHRAKAETAVAPVGTEVVAEVGAQLRLVSVDGRSVPVRPGLSLGLVERVGQSGHRTLPLLRSDRVKALVASPS